MFLFGLPEGITLVEIPNAEETSYMPLLGQITNAYSVATFRADYFPVTEMLSGGCSSDTKAGRLIECPF